jgi:hypothetical protein
LAELIAIALHTIAAGGTVEDTGADVGEEVYL